jgi:hypothetical protein
MAVETRLRPTHSSYHFKEGIPMIRKFKRVMPAAALAAMLTACGGGGGSGGSATATATVAGTAATGAAIASGTVTLQCISGKTSSATTGSDGSFSIDVTGVTLPCVGRVDYKDSTNTAQKLHTFISAAGTANITPVTDLLVANLTSGTAADAFDKFDATKAKAFTAAQVKTAADSVKTYLKNTLGVDTTNLPDDPVGTKLAAKTGSSTGDKFDAVLDDLATKLKGSGKKLNDVEGDLSKGTSSVTAGAAIGTGPYSGVKAADNAKFLSSVTTNCVKDDSLTDAEHTVYKNCKHDAAGGFDKQLVWHMYLGAIPYNGTTYVTGADSATATIANHSGITDVTDGQSCKVGIAEPVIPIIAVKVNNAAYTGQLGLGSFSFNGTAADTIYVTPGGVVLQYNMTDTKGNKLSVSYDTTKGTADAAITGSNVNNWFICK